MFAIVTFDLADADGQAYQLAYDVLEQFGLYPFTQRKGLDLPFTTVLGQINGQFAASDLREAVWNAFEANGLKPTRLLGAVLTDWAAKSSG